MAVVCAAAVLPRCSGVARALLIPLQCWRVLLSCRALLPVRSGVVVWVSVSVWCSCGGVFSVRSPLTVVVGGAVVDGGVPSWMVGGMVSEGRLCCWTPRLVCGVPLVVYPVALLKGGVWCVLCCPVFGLGLAPCIVPVPLALSLFPSYRSCSSSVLCCRVCCGWGSAVGDCVPLPSSVFVFAVTALLV